MRRLLIALSGSMLSAAALAGPAPLQWTANYNPATGGEENVLSAITTAAGETHVLYLVSDRYLRIAKFDATGAAVGTVSLESTGTELRWDLTLVMDSSGNYVAGGRGHTSNDSNDLGAAKWSPTGTLLWATLNVTSGVDESGLRGGAGLDAAGNVYVVGRKSSGGLDDTLLVKFNSGGAFQWAVTTDAVNTNEPRAFAVLPGGGATYVSWYNGLGLSRIRSVTAGGAESFLSSSQSYSALAWSGTSYVATMQSGGFQTRVDELSAGSGSFTGTSQTASYGSGGMYPHTISVQPSGAVFVFGQFGIAGGAVPYIAAFGPHQAGFPVRWSRSYSVGVSEGGNNSGGFIGTVDAGGTLFISNGLFPDNSGGSCSSGGDLVLRRVTPTTGVPLFRVVWDGPLSSAAASMAAGNAGDLLVTTENPARLIKYNSSGALQWSRSFTSSTSYCVSAMNRVVSDGTDAYVAIDARISATFCCLADEEDLIVARYNLATGLNAGFWTWTAVGEINLGPIKFDNPGNVLYVGYGDGSGGGGKIAAVAAFNKTTGAVQWSRTLAETVIDSVTGLSVDASDNIYVSFPWMNGGEMVTRVSKFNSAGAELWTRTVTTGSPLVLALGTAAVPASGGIFLAGGDADNFPPSQTYFRGFLQRLDANGNLLWTRTADAGEQLVYFGVEVSASGTLMTAGFAGPAFQFGEGINAGGLGDIVVHAWDPNATGCAAPMWGGRYDSGYGDESPVGLVAGSTAVAAGTSNGPLVVKFGDGSSDTPVLDTRITVSPSPAEFHPTPAVVTITVTTTNTGGRDAVLVAPALMVTSTVYLTALPAPSPTGPVTLVGGSSQTWSWSVTVVGAGTQVFSLTVSGLDSCGGGTIATVKGASLTTGYRADMVGDMWRTGSILGIGDIMGVTLTVTNNGIGSALASSVSVTLFQIGGPILTPAGDQIRSVGPLAAGASGIMTWTYTATSAGAINLLEQAGWVDALFGYGQPGNSGGDSVTVYDQARLQAGLSVVPSPVSVGQVFTVRLTVTNVGSYSASGVVPSLDINTGAGLLTAKGAASPAGPVSITAPISQTFVWTFTATGTGIIAFTATAQGTDTSPLGYVARASQSWGGFVQTPPVLRGQIVLQPSTIEVGQNVLMTLTITNSGQATAYGITQKMNDFGSATVFMIAGPYPAWSTTLAGGQTIVYSATAVGVTVGTFWNSATVWGYDANSGATIYSTPYTSNVVTVQAAPVLTVALAAFRKNIGPQTHVGQTFLVTATVYNTGGTTVNNVAPQPTLISTGSGAVVQLAGPNPIAPVASIAPGAFALFSWTLSGQAPGAVVLSTTFTGVSSFSGNAITSGLVGSNGLLVSQLLSSAVSFSTPSVNGGQICVVSMTITNTGADIVAGITPVLRLNPASSATTDPASPTNFLLNPGAAQTVTWNLTGLEAGEVSVTAYASGVDAIDSAVPVSTTSTSGVTVTGTLASRVTIVPASPKVGQTFEVRFTVTKTGASTIQNLTPSLIIGDPTAASIESGPTPVAVAILTSAGPHPTFVWTLKALKAGTVGLQATAGGNIISPPGPDSSQSSVSVTIAPAVTVPEFEGDAIVFPNPVTGDAIQVAVKLEPDTDGVTMEIYNTGFQRVFHGEWTGLTGSATLLDIKGIADWAPGAYFIRMIGTKSAGGANKIYKTVRMRIKRTGVVTP